MKRVKVITLSQARPAKTKEDKEENLGQLRRGECSTCAIASFQRLSESLCVELFDFLRNL